MNKPLVSIIIPVYNGANYMKEAIDSALSQTYENIEVIVVNDGSTDDGATEKIALSYGDRIHYFYKENGGVSSALNVGIKNMRGDYFSWLSHDDVYTPTKIEDQITAIKNNKNSENLLCYCKAMHIDKNSNPIRNVVRANRLPVDKVSLWEDVFIDMLKYGTYNGCSFLIPRKVFFEDGLFFDESLRFSQDSLMWYRIFLKKYNLLTINNIDVKGRIHDKQVTQTSRSLFKKDSLAICNLLIDEIIEKSSKQKNFVFYYLMDNAKYGNKEVVKIGKKKEKPYRLLSFAQKIRIDFFVVYGEIRPLIRRIYYRLFRKVNTN